MEANHPYLTTRKSFCVEISRVRDRAELVTDDRAALKPERAKGAMEKWKEIGARTEGSANPCPAAARPGRNRVGMGGAPVTILGYGRAQDREPRKRALDRIGARACLSS